MSILVPETVLRDLELLLQRETKELVEEVDDVLTVVLTLHNHLSDMQIRVPQVLIDMLDDIRALQGMAVRLLEKAEAVPVAIRQPRP